jgi:hypothetical protein
MTRWAQVDNGRVTGIRTAEKPPPLPWPVGRKFVDLADHPLAQEGMTWADVEARERLDVDKAFKAIVIWCAQKFNLTGAQAKAQLLDILKTLP